MSWMKATHVLLAVLLLLGGAIAAAGSASAAFSSRTTTTDTCAEVGSDPSDPYVVSDANDCTGAWG